jgi:hypothetical protein
LFPVHCREDTENEPGAARARIARLARKLRLARTLAESTHSVAVHAGSNDLLRGKELLAAQFQGWCNLKRESLTSVIDGVFVCQGRFLGSVTYLRDERVPNSLGPGMASCGKSVSPPTVVSSSISVLWSEGGCLDPELTCNDTADVSGLLVGKDITDRRCCGV